jgi:hypothetical protein
MGNLKDGNVVVSGVVTDATKSLFKRIQHLTRLSVSEITGEVLTAWHDGREPAVAGMSRAELFAKLDAIKGAPDEKVSPMKKPKKSKHPRPVDLGEPKPASSPSLRRTG